MFLSWAFGNSIVRESIVINILIVNNFVNKVVIMSVNSKIVCIIAVLKQLNNLKQQK